ncbi:hypothetical protein E2C01_023424 [Portunus trituberculatus]|uniref:Uncharacterized protein n=1 Tax=Portunus trituberculatus TaxID=210409 RepID=A0A5B7EBJ2_PORTR|nr:hypothetical protein [Portunus trituberculatus]
MLAAPRSTLTDNGSSSTSRQHRLEQLVFLADLTEWLSFNATLKPLYIFWLPPRLSQTLQKLSEKFV